ncbi:MAG: glutathione S-transferase family protein [Pseudohongiellaceae bacterium]
MSEGFSVRFKDCVELKGVPGSPYTRKMLALLRFRRIPYRLIQRSRFQTRDDLRRFPTKPSPKVELLPTFYVLDEQGEEIAVCDSTPIIRQLETAFGGRSALPKTPVLGFLNELIEDYADEWLTKAMFHYRWSYAPDINKAGKMLPRWGNTTTDESLLQRRSQQVQEHQISRLRYVGSSGETKETIESSFIRFLKVFDNHLKNNAFVFGGRPSSCDFAIFGQLTCLALFDPTPQSIIQDKHPRIYAWTECMEDLSGYDLLDDDWLLDTDIPQTLLELLKEIGHVYAPYLTANAAAVSEGKKDFTMMIDGRPWQQSSFPYQAKCLTWLRNYYLQLDSSAKTAVDNICARTGNSQILG